MPTSRSEAIELIHTTRAGWPGPFLEELVFGGGDAATCVDAVMDWTAAHLGAPMAALEQWHASMGAVAIVRTSEARRAAIKAWPPRYQPAFLAAVAATSAQLAARGWPVPAPLTGPHPIGSLGASALASTVVDDPGLGDEQHDLVTSATVLARLVADLRDEPAARVEALADNPIRRLAPGALWPEPHHPQFDFDATADGAAWIDEHGRLARRDVADLVAAATAPPVIAHGDWAARNLRTRAGRLVALYDLDALATMPEAEAVGHAALTWRALGDGSPFPDRAEREAFADAYGAARGRALSASEHALAAAAARLTCAYTARCEHALGWDGGGATVALARFDEG